MKRGYVVTACFVLCGALGLVSLPRIFAQDNQTQNGFSLQVTPSPLIATIEPGKKSELELKVRNGNSIKESLKMELRSFDVDDTTGEVTITKDTPPGVRDFVRFENADFNIDSGQWFTQKVIIDTPTDAGFSYNFAILISRQNPTAQIDGGSTIEGSVAVFALLNTNRPDATRKLEVSSFISSKRMYEYLPAEFELTIKNSGNTSVQPEGNIFINRSQNDEKPLAVLQINPGNGYTIADSTRILKSSWNEGFPSVDENGKRTWDFSKLTSLRVGKYTANAVVIYDDGQRDIPVNATLSFWVFPWKIFLSLFILLLLIGAGIYTLLRSSFGILKPKKSHRDSKQSSETESTESEE